MQSENLDNKRGALPVIIAIIIVAVLFVGGSIYYFAVRKAATGEIGKTADGIVKTPAKGTAEESLQEFVVSDLGLDLSPSPLGSLKSSALNLSTPDLPSTGIFGEVSVNSDFSYKGDTGVTAPEVSFSYTPPAPTQQPQQPTSQQPTQTQPEQPQQQGQVNVSNCAQFSAMPSAQYCSAVSDPNGKTLCEQCKAAGL